MEFSGILARSKLFEGINEEEISTMLSCLSAEMREFTKGEYIFRRGDTISDLALSYLSEQSIKSGSSSFEIPFNRQQLADYLSVDRSAMSAELCKMRDEGILEFQRNHFLLK